MIPWEKSIYISLLLQYIAEENEKVKLANLNKKR
jgi:hypothetical protein